MYEELKNNPEKLEKFFHYLAYRHLRDQGKCGTENSCPIVTPTDVNKFLSEINNYIDNDTGFHKNYLPNLKKQNETNPVQEGI